MRLLERLRQLKPNDDFGIYVNVRIKVMDLHGKTLETWEGHNLATYAGKNHIRDCLSGAQTAAAIKQFAWGTSNVQPQLTDTQLNAEITPTGRKAVTQFISGTTGSVDVRTTLLSTDANGVNIQEIGLFAASATNSNPTGPNTGTLIARALWGHLKQSTEQIQIDWTLTIS